MNETIPCDYCDGTVDPETHVCDGCGYDFTGVYDEDGEIGFDGDWDEDEEI